MLGSDTIVQVAEHRTRKAKDVAAIDYGPYYLLLATGVVQFVIALYSRHVRRRDQKVDENRAWTDRQELEWKHKTDFQLEELRGIMRRLEYPLKEKLDIDIKLDR